MNDVAAHSADPTPLERRRLGLAPCSRSESTACQRKEQFFYQTFLKTAIIIETHLLGRTVINASQYYGYNKEKSWQTKLAFIV